MPCPQGDAVRGNPINEICKIYLFIGMMVIALGKTMLCLGRVYVEIGDQTQAKTLFTNALAEFQRLAFFQKGAGSQRDIDPHESDPSQNEFDSLPRATLTLFCNNRQIGVSGLVGSGATINVLPYQIGIRLGEIWDDRKAYIRLVEESG